MSVQINPALLVAAVGCSQARAAELAPHLAEVCQRFAITTPGRLAAFLAQIGHETMSFVHLREIWGPTPAQERYEGRADLGNTRPGDGFRYRGRGLIQVTGRDNYGAATVRLRALGLPAPDFEAQPEALEEPRWAAWSAGDYWNSRGLNALADLGQFETITRRINGGTNGQADRLVRWRRAQRVLDQLGLVDQTSPTPAPAPAAPAPAPIPPAPPTPPEPRTMTAPTLIKALLPSLVQQLPILGKLFGSGSAVAERNVETARMALQMVQTAVGARNAQEAVETIAADPHARLQATQALESGWLQLVESGGGGIAGARQADRAAAAGGDWYKSPSLMVAVLLLPLVYMLVLSIIGVWGTASWTDEVRSSLAGLITGTVLGGLMGYYFGQTTSRNRTPAPAGAGD